MQTVAINMAKFYTIVAIVAIALALVAAEPPPFRQSQRFGHLKIQNNRKLFDHHQEHVPEAAPSPTPYPPAGVTPEIPFDLPTETYHPVDEPDQTYGPPKQKPKETYGPPEPAPDQTYGPPEDSPAITEPDNTYGPPATDDQHPIEEPETEEIYHPESNFVSENLIQPRNKNIRQLSLSAPLRSRSRSSPRRSRSATLRHRSVPVQPRSNTV